MGNKKVIIEVTDGHTYAPSVKNGRVYTSVRHMGSTYGSGSPSDTEAEVQSAIIHQSARIREHGDIPQVVDNRITLDRFFN